MAKEKVNNTTEEIRKIVDSIQKEKDEKKRSRTLKALALLVTGAATMKGVQVYGATAVAAMTGSTVSLALLPIPNYFLVILGLGAVSATVTTYKTTKAEMKKENKGKNTKRRFKLED